MIRTLTHNLYTKVFTATVAVVLLCSCQIAYAATLSLTPVTTTITAGNIVSVTISTNTQGEAINNAEGSLQFPTDLLEVVSVSKSPSIFTLWVEEPQFSNGTGEVSFNGGIANPGYTGTSGSIASVVFRAKKSGIANLILTDAAVRKNDGLGTDILTSKNGSTITISQSPVEIKPVDPVATPIPTEAKSVVSAPRITSRTHPNQGAWSNNSTASFSWDIPNGVTALQTGFGKKSTIIPSVTYDNSVTQKTLPNITEGTSYFALRYKLNGVYSPITRYKVNIDTISPHQFSPHVQVDNFNTSVSLTATDDTSGIDYYEIKIPGTDTITVRESQLVNDEYILPALPSGTYTFTITAFDKAGNSTVAVTTATIHPISAPTLSVASKEIRTGDSLSIEGTSEYPHEQVRIVLESNNKEIAHYTQTVTADGTFSVITDPIRTHGIVTLWAENIVANKVHSEHTQLLYVSVTEVALVKITKTVLWIILISILLLILLITLYVGWYKFFSLKKSIDVELEKTQKEVHKAMLLIREELEGQLASLEKVRQDRDLNKKEEKIFRDIENNIDDIDAFIEKKLKKILD